MVKPVGVPECVCTNCVVLWSVEREFSLVCGDHVTFSQVTGVHLRYQKDGRDYVVYVSF